MQVFSPFTSVSLLPGPHRREHPASWWSRIRRRDTIGPRGRRLLVKTQASEVGMPRADAGQVLSIHHGVEVRVVEAGAPRRRIPRRLQRVNLGVREIGRPWSNGVDAMGAPGKYLGARARRLANCHMELAVFSDLRLRLKRLFPIQRYNVGVNAEGDDGSGGVRELLGDEKPSSPVLEQEEHESIPNDALENDDLNHEASGIRAVHSFQKRDAHDESVGESREREESDGPLEAAPAAEISPEGESTEDDEFLQSIGGDEAVVHGVRVVGGYEVEGEQWNGEEGDEAVDAGALVGGEDLPPLDGPVGEDHGDVEGNHGREDVVEVSRRYHFGRSWCF